MLNKNALDHVNKVRKPSTRRSLGDPEPHNAHDESVVRVSDEMRLHEGAKPETVSPIDTRSTTASRAIARHRVLGTGLLLPVALLLAVPFLIDGTIFAGSQVVGSVLSVAAAILLGLWSLSHFRRAKQLQRSLQAAAAAVGEQARPVAESGERVYH